ncbi:Mur ligase [Chlamydoabsidia padenii]|nr:Mur ligase [Chlamydoabsidia padenii]
MPFTYSEAVQKLNSLQSNAALLEQLRKSGPQMNQYSLPEMRQYFKRIGYEPRDFDHLQVIHVAGTKGKGSTSALTQSILRHYPLDRPLRTGLFTSPHLVAVRERIRINGDPISEDLFAKYFQDVWTRLENTKDQPIPLDNQEPLPSDHSKGTLQRIHPDKPVFFRFLTLLALHAFVQEKVDVAILEVGVGGEYDSTNIIENPVVCGITALGMDHVNVLGDTIDQIAWHKSGIIKQNRPVICFDQPPEAIKVIKQRASDKNAPLEIIYPSQVDKLKDIHLGLAGIHQCYNALTAVELSKKWLKECRELDLNQDQTIPKGFHEGLKKVVWPGRGQQLAIGNTKYASKVSDNNKDITWYLDGAHTMESLNVCTEWFKGVAKQDNDSTNGVSRILIFNCTNGRDGPLLLSTLSQLQNSATSFDHVIFTTNVTYRKGYATDNTNNTVSIPDALSMLKILAGSWTEHVPEFDKDNIHVVGSIEEAVDWTLDYSSQTPNRTIQVLTTGSLILVGNTLTVLGMTPQ